MDEFVNEMANLSMNLEEGVQPDIASTLTLISKKLLIEDEYFDKKAYIESLLGQGLTEALIKVLQSHDKFPAACVATAAEIVAEISKTDIGRSQCSDAELVIAILDLIPWKETNVVYHSCRALANVCYDNDHARDIIKERNGVEKLIQLLKNLLEEDEFPENLRTVTSGCLLNLTDTYGEIREQAVQAGILDVLLEYLKKFYCDNDVVTHCLLVLSCLAESECGREQMLDANVLNFLLNIFERTEHDDVIDALLELFGNLCNNDMAKLQLAKVGLCDALAELMKKRMESGALSSGDGLNPYKIVSDLIVLILTGDESMEYLYQDGQGRVYKDCLAWLKSEDENVQVAGALAAGNFARKDNHCIQMVRDGAAKDLLYLLLKHCDPDGDIRMQHAVLCAFRNLSIPVENKSTLVQLGLVESLVSMMNVETFPVVFKLLATLRMIVDTQGKVACDVGVDKCLIQRLVHWSLTDDHPGVKGESTRLLASLVKNSLSPKVMKNLLLCDALPSICSMLKSEHEVMQSEGVVSMTLFASYCFDDLVEKVDVVNLHDNIIAVLKSAPDVVEIALILLAQLLKSERIRYALNTPSLHAAIQAVKGCSNEKIQTLAWDVILKFDH